MPGIGLECKAYRNTGTYASPTWVECVNVKDVTLNLEKGEADISRRGSGGWKDRKGTLKDASVDLGLIWVAAATDCLAFRDGFMSGTPIEMAFASGDITEPGTEYFRCLYEVFKFTREEPLEDAVTHTTTLKKTYSANAPGFTTVPTPP